MLADPQCDWLARTEIEAPAPFACTADHVLAAELGPVAGCFARPLRTEAVGNWRMRDVTYISAPGVALRGGQMVQATYRALYDFDPAVLRARLAQTHYRLADRRVFVGTIRFHANHYHQLIEIVPAVAAYADDPGFADGLLLGPHSAFEPLLRAALQLAGITPPEIVPCVRPVPLDIADLTFCSLLTGWQRPSLFCRGLYDRMVAGALAAGGASGAAAGAAGHGDALEGAPLIYVWRADSTARPMRNEDALVERLTRLGVVPVVLSTLTLAEQVRLFHAARLVIGPHGAGLANVVFGAAGAVLYELLPSHYANPCISRLAQLRGLHYWCDVHPAEERPGVWRHEVPWSVDIDAVAARVETILAAYGLR